MTAHPIRIGTRGSRLALAQAHAVRAALAEAAGRPEDHFAIEVISTSGDRIQDRPLSEVGGKGLFTKEIEEALTGERIDLAVHSAKDMATRLPPGLRIAACLAREDVRDVFIGRGCVRTIADLPQGAVVGSASLRRQALLRRVRPDLDLRIFRGNVQTRLAKLERGEVEGTLLALAGLRRLGDADAASEILPLDRFPPAPGQGAIAIETRRDDAAVNDLLARIDHAPTRTALRAERAFLRELDGSCRTPIAGHAVVEGDRIRFLGLILSPDGREAHETQASAAAGEAEALGRACGHELRERAGPGFFEGW